MVREIESETGIPRTTGYCVLTKQLFKKKSVCVVSTTCIDRHTKTDMPQNHARTFKVEIFWTE